MNPRTLILIVFAILLAGGTALLARSWLAEGRREAAEAAPVALQTPGKSVLVARGDIKRGQILRPDDLVWQVWPEGGLDKNYVVMGTKTPESYAGWVARNPISGGEPIMESKIIKPGDRGFLAAVLAPGMRAISVPVTVTSGISGFIFPGDRVDLMLTYTVPPPPNEQGKSFDHRVAQTMLRDIRVVAIDQRTDSKAGEAVVAHTATFEVTAKQGEAIALANEIGKVSLTLRSLTPGPNDAPAGTDATADAATPGGRDSSIAAGSTYTYDSEISPLFPKPRGSKDSSDTPEPISVTILRGGGKGSESVAAPSAPKG